MEHFEMKDHNKHGSILSTPFNEELGDALHLTDWLSNSVPEYVWIGLILSCAKHEEAFGRFSHIVDILNRLGIVDLEFSKIIALSTDKQERFIEAINGLCGDKVLRALSAVIDSQFSECFSRHYIDSPASKEDIEMLIKVIDNMSNIQKDLSTDICYCILVTYIKKRKIDFKNIPEEGEIIEALKNYWKFDHSDKIMLQYGTSIRSLYKAIENINESQKRFCSKFWNKLSNITECKPLFISYGALQMDSDYKTLISKTIEYINSNNADKRLCVKYSVVMGIIIYIYKMYLDIEKGRLQNSISGRIILRSIIEEYINLEYMLTKESEKPEIYELFKDYGLSKYKLVSSKLRDGKYPVVSNSHVQQKILELYINEEKSEDFQNIDLGYFEKDSIRKKFEICREEELYEIYYEYDTNYAHGFWSAIRESAMIFCNNPSHKYHAIPDYKCESNLPSVESDCRLVIDKAFMAVSNYLNFPDFYICYHNKNYKNDSLKSSQTDK